MRGDDCDSRLATGVPVVALAAASAVRASYAAMRADVSSETLPERGGGVRVAAGEGKDSIFFAGRGGGAL